MITGETIGTNTSTNSPQITLATEREKNKRYAFLKSLQKEHLEEPVHFVFSRLSLVSSIIAKLPQEKLNLQSQ
jgi:ppGpp synthetase/RelA/SpoT-type nucleotidyltranferase